MTDRHLDSLEALEGAVLRALEDGKAQNVVVIDLMGKTDVADRMVIASATSSRHASHLSQAVVEAAKKVNVYSPPPEGEQSGDWVLIDLQSIIVHVFRNEVRDYYKLERMWGSAAEGAPSRASIDATEKTEKTEKPLALAEV